MKTLQLKYQDIIFNNKQCKVLTIRDITEIKRFAKVSADNKMLSLLNSSVTHEMITPLKCVIQFGTTLLKSKDPKVVKEAELIVSTAKLLLSQVKQTLDKNMLDNNSFTPNFEYYPLNKSIIDVTRILNGQAALQNISFKVSVPEKEVVILLDQLRLQQVIINLLSNAIKFSKAHDTINVEVTTESPLNL